MKLCMLLCVLALGYKVTTPTLMQTGSDSGDSVLDYVDTSMTEETSEQAQADAAAASYDDDTTAKEKEDEATETAKHNKEAESTETPQGETDTSTETDTQGERQVEADSEAIEYTGSVTDSVRELAIETNSLQNKNFQLNKDNEVLEDIVVNTVVKLEKSRIDNSRDSYAYKQEINEEVRLRESLYKETNKTDTSDEDSQEQPEFEASSAMTFVMSVALFFLFFQGAQYLLGSLLDPYLEPTLQALFSDVTVMTVMWAVSYIFYYTDLFEEDSFDLEKVLVGLGVFILVWLMLGLWLIFAAQSHARKWIQLENECNDMRKLKNSYEEAFNEHKQGKSDKNFEAKRDAMQYAVMRQEFIRPTYQVPVSEIILRSDFELSEYLSRCLSRIVDETMQLSWLSYCICVVAILFWRLVLVCTSITQLIILILVPLIIWSVLLTLKAHLNKVYYELVPYILDPYEVHLIDNYSKEPLQNVDKIPRPPYLRGKFPGREESQDALGRHPLKLTCAFIFGGIFPNRHQTLFYFDSYGPKIILYCLQGIFIISVLWLTVLILFYGRMLWYMIGEYSIILYVASFALWIVVACIYLSECIRGLCLSTKLEQMKDREQIKAVVVKGKADRAIRAMRMYRKLKLIYREQNPEAESSLSPKQQAMLIEAYELQAKGGELHISALDETVMLLGFQLEEDELRHFAKECEPDAKFMITFENFRRAVSRLLSSAQLKPEAVAKRVLRNYFKKMQRRDKVSHISMTDLE
mmetsp:Transcript_27531/g.49642  ORF Transcript_27531/g.49642 Transcript_27531/m.49642 type:complete len:751 (+) Transcript_27531:18-2270(+)